MLKIEITDPHTMPPEMLIKTATFLLGIAGYQPETQAPVNYNIGLMLNDVAKGNFDLDAEIEKAHASVPTPVSSVVPPVPSIPVPPTSVPAPRPAWLPAPVAPALTGVELDCRGLPWDNRIHSRTKSKLANGEWKVQRGIDAAVVAQVELELRQTMSAPVSTPQAPIAPVSVPTPPIAPISPPPAPTIPVTIPPIDPIDTDSVIDFPKLMTFVTSAVSGGTLTLDAVNQACQSVGVASLALMGARPDLVPQVYTLLQTTI
jgi:hypothetical protein